MTLPRLLVASLAVLSLAACGERKPADPPGHAVAPVGDPAKPAAPEVSCSLDGPPCPDGKSCTPPDTAPTRTGTCK